MWRRGISQTSPASALFDFFQKLIKTVPSSWLKQFCSSQKPLQMTLNVKKIILSISVWPVHLWTGIIQENRSMNVGENNSGIHPLCFFLFTTFAQMLIPGCKCRKGHLPIIPEAWEIVVPIRKMIHFQLSAITIISLFLDFLKYIYSFSNCDRSFIGPGIELTVRYNDNKPSPYSSKSSIDHSMCIALCLVLGI